LNFRGGRRALQVRRELPARLGAGFAVFVSSRSGPAAEFLRHQARLSITTGHLMRTRLPSSSARTTSSVLDHASIIVAFVVASGMASFLGRYGLFVWPGPVSADVAGWPKPYFVLLIAGLILWTAASTYGGIYQAAETSKGRAFHRLWRTLALWAAATTAAIFFLKLHAVSRQFSLTFFVMAAALITFREFGEVTLAARRDGPMADRRAIVIGSRLERHEIAETLAHSGDFRPDRIQEFDPEGVEVATRNAAFGNTSTSEDVRHHAYVVTAGLEKRTIETVILGLLRNRWCVHVVPALVDTRLFHYRLDDFGDAPAICLEAGRLAPVEAAFKRALDMAGAVFGLFILAPLFAVIAVVIKTTSPGPVLFSQPRIGRDGKKFRLYKFRSMRTDAEEILKKNPDLYAKYVANNFKLPPEEDFRITRIGRFLRTTSLDELPQLLNVLKGEMSLVGPRPVVPDEIVRYGEFASLLLSVKPGMTGHWQTSGRSRIAEYSKRIFLDMEYIRDQSLRTDVGILIRTVGKVARREGSY
jgi:exopolysaccharide production protein ExoY